MQISDDFEEIFQVEPRPIDETIEHCKGIYFRGFYNQYYQDGKFEIKQGIKLLKRKSCPGCNKCGFILDNLQELSCVEGSIILPKYGIEHGKLYSVIVTNESRDWESGVVDDWDLEIIKVEEEK